MFAVKLMLFFLVCERKTRHFIKQTFLIKSEETYRQCLLWNSCCSFWWPNPLDTSPPSRCVSGSSFHRGTAAGWHRSPRRAEQRHQTSTPVGQLESQGTSPDKHTAGKESDLPQRGTPVRSCSALGLKGALKEYCQNNNNNIYIYIERKKERKKTWTIPSIYQHKTKKKKKYKKRMDRSNNKKKSMTANTSATWQHAAHTTDQLTSPNC